MFSGIGGWELGLTDLPMENVLSCEIDKYARARFLANISHLPCVTNDNYPTDIRKLNPADIPGFDILVGSPPCQSFSLAGQRQGLRDSRDDKGNMFFYVLDIIKAKQPRAFILENVKGLLTAEKGRSFRVIHDLFRNAGYSFHYKVIKGSDCGIPQIRQRLFMVGFRNDECGSNLFKFPDPVPLKFTLCEVFNCVECDRDISRTLMTMRWDKKYGQDYNFATYMVDGSPRTITINEAKKIMGTPPCFKMPVPEKQQQKQLDNGIIPECVKMVAENVIRHLQKFPA